MRGVAEPPAKALRTPRAAGAAGILSALPLGGAMILVRKAVPAHPLDAAAYLADTAGHNALRVALILLPFGGIFFLWFMGAVRDSIGVREDRFFATVFFGAGLLFVAMLFVFGATASAYLATIDAMRTTPQPTAFWHYGRHLTLSLLTEYAPRMAAVFTLTTTTIGTRLGLLPRWLSWLGYLVGLVLLLVVSRVAWSELAFPVWVLIVGCYLIVAHDRFRMISGKMPTS
ncbi:hypothetical protein AB0F17_22560 [Nonomuraea sp. NPDC026600]|uniref:hypothetical protein n=1 Tax=Nonomuraea sp. NPDC026600 TaxID=3155363 RepID=UPI003411CBB7